MFAIHQRHAGHPRPRRRVHFRARSFKVDRASRLLGNPLEPMQRFATKGECADFAAYKNTALRAADDTNAP